MIKNGKDNSGKIFYNLFCRLLPALIVVVFVFIAFSNFKSRNSKTIIARNEEYIKDFTVTVANKLDDEFTNSIVVIESIARLNANQNFSDISNADYLKKLEVETRFDHIQVVDLKGLSYSSAGTTVDVSDKDYFKNAINGISGSIVVMDSRYTNQRQIGFYTPIVKNDSIKGVMVAFYDEKTVKASMEYHFYGEKAAVGIVNAERRNVKKSDTGILNDDFSDIPKDLMILIEYKIIDEENGKKIIDAYRKGVGCTFYYTGNKGKAIGYMMPLSAVPLVIYMTFPSEAVDMMYSESNDAGISLLYSLLLIFAIYVAFLAIVYVIRMKSAFNKNKLANYIADAENAVSRGIILVDTEEQTFENLSGSYLSISKTGNIEELKNHILKIDESDEDNKEEIAQFFEDEIISKKNFSSFPQVVFNQYDEIFGKTYTNITYVPVEIKNDQVEKGVLLLRNITAGKSKEDAAQERLKTALASAEKANRAKTVFLNNMSHDIRTPMNAIIGYTKLAASHIEDKVQVEDYLSKIETSSSHLLSLINDIIDMSRIESGQVKIEKRTISISQLMDDLQTIVSNSVEEKHQTFNVDVEKIRHDKVITDSLRIKQSLVNLISNAIKYTPVEGKIDVLVKELDCKKNGYATYLFKVKDNGIGISKEFQEHMFEVFTRESSASASGVEGTGLGLAITKNIIDMMGGKISFESEVGKGTEFTVELTLKTGEENTKSYTEDSDDEVQLAGKKILLVEDNELNQEVARTILEESGLDVEIANDGLEAVEKIIAAEDDRYDIVLLDIQMPQMDGYEATKRIRAMKESIKSKIPIIAMTANAFDDDKKRALMAGMDGHVAKPIDVSELMKALSAVLNR